MKISILTDNPQSWIIPYVEKLKIDLSLIHKVRHVFEMSKLEPGDILLILSCEKIIKKEYLKLHKSNIVVHPSKLPKGKGWSPLAWQILEGSNCIPVTLFEASEELDSGPVYLIDNIILQGHELNDEIKDKQGLLTIKMIKDYIDKFPNIKKIKQVGDETFYPRRLKKDSELDLNKTIKEQFSLLRISDNERYPAYFTYNGFKYIIKITKENLENNL